jgi:hypothetical protein
LLPRRCIDVSRKLAFIGMKQVFFKRKESTRAEVLHFSLF